MAQTVPDYLLALQAGINQIKSSLGPSSALPPTINGMSLKDFEIQLSAYLSNKNKPNKIIFFPMELNNPGYLDRVLNEINLDLSTLQGQNTAKASSYVANNLPNLPLLMESWQNYQQLKANEALQNQVINRINAGVGSQTQVWISRLRQQLEDTIKKNVPLQDQARELSKIDSRINEILKDSTNLSPDVVPTMLEGRAKAELNKIQGLNINLDQEAKNLVSSVVPEISEANRIKIEAENVLGTAQAKRAWEEAKIGTTSTIGHILTPTELNYLTANIACEMTRSDYAGLSGTPLQDKLEQVVRQQLSSTPYVGFFVLPKTNQDLLVRQLVQNSFPAIETLHAQLKTPASVTPLEVEQHNRMWANVAYGYVDPNTNTPFTIEQAKQSIDNKLDIPKFHDPKITSVDILYSGGAPLGIFSKILSPDYADKTIKHLLTGGPFKSALEIIPGRLSSEYARYLLMYDPKTIVGIKAQAIQDQMLLVGKTNLSANDYYSLREAESTIQFIDYIEKHRNDFWGKSLSVYRFTNKIFHPIQSLQMKIISRAAGKGGFGNSAMLLMTQLAPYFITRPELASVLTVHIFKSLGLLAIKSALLKTGWYTLAGEGPFKQFVFKPLYDFKLRIRRALFSKLTGGIASGFTKKILGVLLGFGTGPVGIALALFGSKLKKLVQGGIAALGILLYGLVGTYAIPIMLGLIFGGAGAIFFGIPGFLIGAAIGGVLGMITVFVINGFSLPHFGPAGGFTPTVYAEPLTPTTALAIPSPALATGIVPFLPVITIGGVAVMSVYTMMVTSSAFFTPGGAPAGYLESKYIDASKKAELFLSKNNPLPEGTKVTDNWIAENNGYVVYTLSVSPKNQPLKNVVIKDITRLTRRENPDNDKTVTSQITTKLLVDKGGGNYEFTENAPESWTIPTIDRANPWAVKYGFVLNKDQTDSYINNAVNIEAEVEGETEKQTYTMSLTLTIGKPPVLPIVQIAKNLVDRLTACYPGPGGKAEVNQAVFGNGSCVLDSTKNPQGVTFGANTLVQLSTSVGVPSHYVLQCIGFVQAVLQEAGTPFSKKDDAQNFYGYSGDGFVWHDNNDLRNIKEGDVMIAQWLNSVGDPVSGHAAIVIERNDNGFFLAETLGYNLNPDTKTQEWRGLTQYPSAFYTFDRWEKYANIGFLRYGE